MKQRACQVPKLQGRCDWHSIGHNLLAFYLHITQDICKQYLRLIPLDLVHSGNEASPVSQVVCTDAHTWTCVLVLDDVPSNADAKFESALPQSHHGAAVDKDA